MNVVLIHHYDKRAERVSLVAVVECPDGIDSNQVLNSWLGRNGLRYSARKFYSAEFAPLILWDDVKNFYVDAT